MNSTQVVERLYIYIIVTSLSLRVVEINIDIMILENSIIMFKNSIQEYIEHKLLFLLIIINIIHL